MPDRPGLRLEDNPPVGVRISDVGGERALVRALARNMEEKLVENRGKRHWRTPDVSDEYLLGRLREEVDELEDALFDGNDAWLEAADIANFAAMLADRHFPLSDQPAPDLICEDAMDMLAELDERSGEDGPPWAFAAAEWARDHVCDQHAMRSVSRTGDGGDGDDA